MEGIFVMDVDTPEQHNHDIEYHDSDDEIDFDNNDTFVNNSHHYELVPRSHPESSLEYFSEDPKMTINDFELMRILGKGGFGKVFQVKKKYAPDANKVFAMKVLKKSTIVNSKKETQHTKSERNILGTINSDFVCKLYYAFQTQEKLYFVLEFLEGGELFMLLDREGLLTEQDAAFYSSEIVIALEHLHALSIIYRDLKPENVMLDRYGHVKLTDFGLCKEDVTPDTLAYTYCGTVEYMSPEIITKIGHNHAADWWSLGTIMYDMITGKPPFVADNKKSTIDKILNGRVYFPGHVSNEAKILIRGLLKKDPSKRLGYLGPSSIKKQKFFSQLDWRDVELRSIKPPFIPHEDRSSNTNMSKYFDPRFLTLPVIDSPADRISTSRDPFVGFTYTATDFMTENIMKNNQDELMDAIIHNPKPAKSNYHSFPSSFY